MRAHSDRSAMYRLFSMCRLPAVSCPLALCLALAFACAFAQPEAAAGPDSRPMRFAVLGDRTGGHQPGVHGQILAEIERMKPDFVIGVGDMIEGYGSDTTATKAEWKAYMELLEPLSMPIYFTPGNHDIWDSVSEDLYRRLVGEPYYSFDIDEVHFIVLDTSRWLEAGNIPEEQIDWLKGDLAANTGAEATFVVYHAPQWFETVALGEPDQLHPIFLEHGVDAVFNGHYHTYFTGEYDGILYTAIGSSGGYADPGITGVQFHFAWVTVDDGQISIAPVKAGSVLPWDEVAASTLHLIEEIRAAAMKLAKLSVGTGTDVSSARIDVDIVNMSEDQALRTTLEWEIPGAWRVSPKDLPVEIAPSGSLTQRFTVSTDGPIYPVPMLSMEYPYEGDLTVTVEKPLPIERTVYAVRTEEAPVIDGDLSEEMWKDPERVFFGPDGSPMSTDSAFFCFAWDEANLYLGAECMETRLDSVFATIADHDGAVYGEDCVGYFLQPEVPDGPVYQVYFNPLGTAFDQKISVEDGAYSGVDREWNGTYETAAAMGGDRWTIEIRIPLEVLETRGEYEKIWTLNFRRKQRRLQTSADWQVPISYNPDDYGIMIMR